MVAVPFMADLPRPRRRVRRRRARRRVRRSCRTATWRCRWRHAASWPPAIRAARSWRSCRATQSVHETRNFFARLPRDPRRQRAGHRPRRRRRVRPEDVRLPRGVRGGTGVAAARPAGEVDRGPPRESAVGRRHSRNEFGNVRMADRRATASSRRSPSSTRPTSARTRRARRHGPDAAARAVQDPALRLRHGDGAGPTRWARAPTAARGCSRPPHARWRSTTPPTRSASTRPSSGAGTCSRR